jgi:outer membrane protein
MRRTIQFLVLAAILAFAGQTYAQKVMKFGHFNSTELIKRMPEGDSAQTALKAYVADIESELGAMRQEYERLANDYRTKEAQLSDLLKESKQKQIQDVANRYQEFQANSQDSIQKKQADLMNGLFEKIRSVVADIAKEEKYTYIFESNGILWYAEDSEDITPKLLKKMNIK